MDPQQIPLRDLHLPDAVGWWPPAPGWWVLVALLALGMLLLVRRYVRYRARGAAQRHALKQLEVLRSEFAENGNAVALGAGVSELLRRTMLAYRPRGEVAGLTGEDWLRWLDRDLGAAQFTAGPGRCLLDLPYRDPAATDAGADVDGLLAAVRERLATPVGGSA